MAFVSLLFILWRIVDLIITFLTNIHKPLSGDFAFGARLNHYIPNALHFLTTLANFDGAHYILISNRGYYQDEQTYFPLYPLLIHFISPLFGNSHLIAGIVITNICFLGGLYFFKKYLENLHIKLSTIRWTILFLLCFPTSFFFGAVYTEGLFFLLVTATLYFASKRSYVLLLPIAILAGLTRLIGVFLVIPIVSILFANIQNLSIKQKTLRGKSYAFLKLIMANKKLILISLAPLIGLGGYMAYLAITINDPLAFYHLQNGFNNGRSANHLIFLPQVYYRYIRIFITASYNMTYFVAAFEFVLFNLFLVVVLYDFWKLWKQKFSPEKIQLLGLNLFSLANLLLPTFTGTLTSMPRYVLLSLSFFIRISEIKNTYIRISFIILFLIFHVISLSLFVQGYFVG